MADFPVSTTARNFPISTLIPAWRVSTDFEYNRPDLRKLPITHQIELWATQLLHELVQALDVEPVERVTLGENGVEFIEIMIFIPLWLLDRLVEFDADGDLDIETQCEGGRSFVAAIGIEYIGAIVAEMREASLQMTDLQAAKLDHGAHKFRDLCRDALRPIDLQVLIEPMTGDRISVFQFADHAPLALRRTPTDVLKERLLLARAEARSLH